MMRVVAELRWMLRALLETDDRLESLKCDAWRRGVGAG
jgi:hypothetical protein